MNANIANFVLAVPLEMTYINEVCNLEFCNLRGGKSSHMHTWMQIINPSTSAKPFMTKLQILYVELVNMDIYQMTLKFSLFTID